MNWSPARTLLALLGARVGWELALTHPEAVASLTLGGLPLHDHLITLRAMLEAHEGTSVTADSETPAADSTDEAIASFTSIIDNSPIQPDALLKFVRIPFGPFFDVPALRAGSPDLPAGHPGAHPHAPIAVVLGDADTIAADGAELYDMVRRRQPAQPLHLPARPRPRERTDLGRHSDAVRSPLRQRWRRQRHKTSHSPGGFTLSPGVHQVCLSS